MAIMVSEVYEAFLEAGASKEKAKAAAESIPLAEQLATQQNVSELKQGIDDVRTELKQEIGELRTELKQEIGELRTELKQEIAELRTELKQEIGDVKSDIKLLKWMVGVILACVAFPLLKSLLV